MHLEALGDLALEPLLQAAELQRGLVRQVVHRDLLLGDEAGENDVEQVLRQRGHGHFRGQVRAVEVLDPAAMGVGFQQLIDQAFHRMIHIAAAYRKSRCPCKCGCRATSSGTIYLRNLSRGMASCLM